MSRPASPVVHPPAPRGFIGVPPVEVLHLTGGVM